MESSRWYIMAKTVINLWLPEDMVRSIIGIIISIDIIQCFNTYKRCVHSSEDMLAFIDGVLINDGKITPIPHKIDSIINIIKICLYYSKLTLHEHFADILSLLYGYPRGDNSYRCYVDILCRIADNKAVDLLSCAIVTERTILHCAIVNEDIKMVKTIIKYAGVNMCKLLSTKDRYDRTPRDLCIHVMNARKSNNIEIIYRLLEPFTL